MRAVIDTNIWVSAGVNRRGAPAAIRRLLIENKFELIALLRYKAELVSVTASVVVCRDPDDNVVVEAAINGSADVVVTRNDDLKSTADVRQVLDAHGIAVLTVRRFLSALGAHPDN